MSANIGKINTDNIVEAVRILENIHDVVRVVDPVQNTVIYVANKTDPASVHKETCFTFWHKEKFCNNCVSLRAIKEKDTFVKFEVVKDRIFMITASPVEYQGHIYVVEMLSDITDKGILESIAGKNPKDFASLVLRLNDALVRDELTRLFNRRYINERLPVEIFHSIAASTPASLVIVDLDKFKQVNDNYGHSAGDMVLQQFSRLLTEGVRNYQDWVARYGGDEFLLHLHNTDSKQAVEVAERVRKVVESAKFIIQDRSISITCSIGICELQKGMDVQEWFDQADKKLYAAKAGGGNRVVV